MEYCIVADRTCYSDPTYIAVGMTPAPSTAAVEMTLASMRGSWVARRRAAGTLVEPSRVEESMDCSLARLQRDPGQMGEGGWVPRISRRAFSIGGGT